MTQTRIKAAFIRGGTSKGVFFHANDLPENGTDRDEILLKVLGSPDPYSRQLDGMGGGISSLSKAVIIAPSNHANADIDYTFAQVSVDSTDVDYSANCGNLSSAVGPFAVDEGLVLSKQGSNNIKIFNTNTNKFFTAEFEVNNNKAITKGDLYIPGIATSGAPIKLNFSDPGGATTGLTFPSGNAVDKFTLSNNKTINVSLVDVSNAVVFVNAKDLDIDIALLPEELEQIPNLMQQLEEIRCLAAVKMGLVESPEQASVANPKVALIDTPANFTALDKQDYKHGSHHINVRMVSMQRMHKAVTLTGAMCLASAIRLPDTIANQLFENIPDGDILIANPSGVLPVNAEINHDRSTITKTSVWRTQRRLMDGYVYL